MHKLSEKIERKFIDEIDVDEWEIETDTGWKSISAVKKTVEYEVWKIVVENGKTFEGADTHILFTENLEEIYLKDVVPNETKLMTDDGPSMVVSLENLGHRENMYDLEVDSNEHRFYANGFLSHNSITSIGFFLWYTLFNEFKTIAILANKGDTARGLLARYKLAYEYLPLWLQQGVKDGGWNKGSIELENGCQIFAGSTSSDAARSKSINVLYLDEFAFVPTNLADDFYKSTYPTISSGKTTKIIIVSTANGMNHFHKMWKEANMTGDDWNGFTPKRVDWWQVPGRDEEWKEKTISETSEEDFAQEFGNCLGKDSLISICINNIIYKIRIGDLYESMYQGYSSSLSINERVRQKAICWYNYKETT